MVRGHLNKPQKKIGYQPFLPSQDLGMAKISSPVIKCEASCVRMAYKLDRSQAMLGTEEV
jgi:hypothetical protein